MTQVQSYRAWQVQQALKANRDGMSLKDIAAALGLKAVSWVRRLVLKMQEAKQVVIYSHMLLTNGGLRNGWVVKLAADAG